MAGFVTDNIIGQAQKSGLEIRRDSGELRLRGELLEFWVEEKSSYAGTVRVKFMLRDQDEKELWTAVVSGAGSNWGRSLKPANYTETYTNALADLVTNLFAQPGFTAALRKGQASK